MDTPYQWTKQVASHWGGTRNGTIVHWPNGIKAKGEVRTPVPSRDRRRRHRPRSGEAAASRRSSTASQQAPLEGVSMLYAFNDAKAADRHETQYFEVFCNRGIYHKGWTRRDPAQRPVDRRLQAHVRRGRLGAVRHQHRLDAGARSREGEPEEARRAADALHDRGDQVRRLPARRSAVRAVQPGHRRPSAADQGQLADPVRRHGTPDRELDRLDQEQVLLGDRRRRRAGSPAPRASSSRRAAASTAGASTPRAASSSTATTSSASS